MWGASSGVTTHESVPVGEVTESYTQNKGKKVDSTYSRRLHTLSTYS